MHFTMSENALARKGERGSYFTRPNPKFTRQCERASGILHPCTGKLLWTKCLTAPVITQTFGKRVIAKLIPVELIPLMTLILVQFRLQLSIALKPA